MKHHHSLQDKLKHTSVSNINRGGGWSFLNMPMDKDGNQWGEQLDAEALLAVAIGAGVGGYLMPREFWASLPGGVPYVWFGQKGV